MIKLKNTILAFFRNLAGSIAFYPTIIALGMSMLAFIVLFAERYRISEWLGQYAEVVLTYSVDTARSILTVLIGSILSLTVFSFSMVMILINQAASNFSPRVVPGLISSKSHQYVLGVYLGTVLYCLLVLINIYKPDQDKELPGFAILLAIVFGVVCMGLFVYFIHNISTSIQASSILKKIFNDSRHDLLLLQQEERRHLSVNEAYKQPETSYPVYASESGYLQGVSGDSLLQIVKEKDMVLQVEVAMGMFVLKNIPVANTSKEVDDDTVEQILSSLQFSNQEMVKKNYILGFKQITEVAVKAMSPGINDPGTALTALDYLTELLSMRMTISDYEFLEDDKGDRRVFYQTVSFKELIYNTMASLRQYVKHDVILVQKMLTMLRYLHCQKEVPDRYLSIIVQETKTLMEDAEANITNKGDLALVKKQASAILGNGQ